MTDKELAASYLLYSGMQGLKVKGLYDNKEYYERLLYEHSVITQMNFTGYFLVVADFIKWSKLNGVSVGPGRGSGAGSLMAYALGITTVDPIKYGLYWERFLNPHRISMPDFDIDFSQRYRVKVFRYLLDKYGSDRIAQIGTVLMTKAKSAIKDTARTLGYSAEDGNRFSSYIPAGKRGGKGSYEVTLHKCVYPDEVFLKEYGGDLTKFRSAYEFDSDFKRVVDAAASIEDSPKSFSQHAAGVIIAPEPIGKYIPLHRRKVSSKKSEGFEDEEDSDGDLSELTELLVTEWPDKVVEAQGWVKFDFLGLRTLDVIADAVASINKRESFDIDAIEDGDSLTYELLGSGETFGLFQVNESGMAAFTKAFKPVSIEDISAISALYRPGPLDNGMVSATLQVRSGGERPSWPAKVIDEILDVTNGVLTYQEQILEIARKMAGYSMGEADLLRRAIGKKLQDEMAKQRERFVKGCIDNGHREEVALFMFEKIEAFADYCFNKAHSVAYSILTYQTAYLKAHYPIDFYAAELSSYGGEVKKILPCIHDMRRRGVSILLPDINTSEASFTATEGAVRFGLEGIKGLGEAALNEIIQTRQHGPFKSLHDFYSRVSPTIVKKNNLKALAYSGALSSLAPDLNILEILDYLTELEPFISKTNKDKKSGQLSIFDSLDLGQQEWTNISVKSRPLSLTELLEYEREALGIYISGSPLQQYSDLFSKLDATLVADLTESGSHVSCVLQISKVVVRQGKGGSFAFVTAQDESGAVSCKLWANTFSVCQHLLQEGNIVVVRGRTQLYRDQIELTVDSMTLASEELNRSLGRVVLHKIDSKILSLISTLSLSDTVSGIPIDLEIDVLNLRYRLGFFNIDSSIYQRLNEFKN